MLKWLWEEHGYGTQRFLRLISIFVGVAVSSWIFCRQGNITAGRKSNSVDIAKCDLIPYDLTVEHLSSSRRPEDQVTIDPESARAPRFSFKAASKTTPSPEAIASHIQVIRPSKCRNCGKTEEIVWDSDWVRAGRSNGLDITRDQQLDGLVPMERLIWRARFGISGSYNAEDLVPCPWSHFESFLVGPSKEQWDQADWICATNRVESECDFYDTEGKATAPIFRTEFDLSIQGNESQDLAGGIASATLFVSGLGHYEAWMNGVHINHDRFLDPAPTSYDKRIYYNSFDVTDTVRESNSRRQVLGFVVGNGWFNPMPMKFWGARNLREYLTVGTPRVRCVLVVEYIDENLERLVITTTTASRSSLSLWTAADSALLRNDLYLGNVVDLDRLHSLEGWSKSDFDNPLIQWQQAQECPASSKGLTHASAFEPQPIPPIRSRTPHRLHPRSRTSLGDELVLDMGLNTAAAVRVNVVVPHEWVCSAQQIELKFGELLFPNGTVNVETSIAGQIKEEGCCGPCAPAAAYQRLILRTSRSAQYTTQFSWHGFRYVQIGSLPPGWEINVTAIPLMTDLRWTSFFESSNALLNDIFRLCQNTHASNMMGIQSDCPHRERFGYTGDALATLPTSLTLFDGAAFYEKRLYDVHDSLRVNGGVTETAPYVGIATSGLGDGSGPIGWQSFFPNVQLALRRYFGNTRASLDMLRDTRRWVQLVINHTYEVERGLGDWCALDKVPVAISGRIFLVEALRAWILLADSDDEKVATRERLQQELVAFDSRFVSESNGDISINGSHATQAGQALALYYDMIAETRLPLVVESFVRAVERSDRHITAGMFGVLPLFEALTMINRTDLAWDIAMQRSYPSYGYMLDNNATTIWESWAFSDSRYSHNHPMFSGVASWMTSHIGGIQVAHDAIGSDRLIFAPKPPVTSGLRYARTILDTARGRASCEWRCQMDGTVAVDIVCPVHTRGLVILPDGSDPISVRGGKYHFKASAPSCQDEVAIF